jgi:hypothetical protein
MESELEKIDSKKKKKRHWNNSLGFGIFFNQTCETPNVYTFSKEVDVKLNQTQSNWVCNFHVILLWLLLPQIFKDKVVSLIENAYHIPQPEQPHMLFGKYIEHI